MDEVPVGAQHGLVPAADSAADAGSSTDANEGPRYVDQFHFVHRPLTGDGTLTAQVTGPRAIDPWARAGLLIKQDTRQGTPYAAIMVTRDHGVRMQTGFSTELSAGPAKAPRWLRLVRSGSSVTGQHSADGRAWTTVGTFSVPALPSSAQAGLFVTSPSSRMERRGTSTGTVWVPGVATFSDVAATAAGRPQTGPWTNTDVGGAPQNLDGTPVPGGSTATGTGFTVRGTGDLRALRPGEPGDDDIVKNSLAGVYIGLIAVVALGALFATSEYKTGLIRTTFAMSPRRGRVLVAKAIVLAGAVFAAGLAASFAAFFLTQPLARSRGYEPPAYPHPSLADGPVLRAVVGTALFLALMALVGLAIGTILRRSAGAITLILALVLVPAIAAGFLPIEAEQWVNRLTPLAGLAVQQTRERFDNAIGPWPGVGVLCAYVVVVLVAAVWSLRRRDA
jgi:ABC-type transport system involved in multi-copper enzyme maturation permease subunit